MDKTAKRPTRRGPAGSDLHALKRLTLLFGAGMALLPVLTVPVAQQDMTSLLEGAKSQSRWQAYFVPSPAGAIEKAQFAFAGAAQMARLPKGAGIEAGDRVYTMETSREAFETPDEARVNRRDKGGRVLAETPRALPKAFSAGSILERQSLLTPSFEPGATGLLAASRPVEAGRAIEVAMNFSPLRDGGGALPTGTPDRVMVASLTDGTNRHGAKDGGAAVVLASVAGVTEKVETGEVTALGYAAVEPATNPVASLFGRILNPNGRGGIGFVPPIGRDDHAWAATPLPTSAFSAKEQTCLATGIYFEARGESQEGQAAVAQVILNRVRNPTYPKTICGVVYQNSTWRNRCQFSFACDAFKDRILNKRAYAKAKTVADRVTSGDIWLAAVGSSTHYHATYVHPRWANAMKKVDKIGRHIFYRTYGGGWN